MTDWTHRTRLTQEKTALVGQASSLPQQRSSDVFALIWELL